jgi:hypothetical protein
VVRRYHNSLMYTHSWKPFWICPWDPLVSLMKLSSGKETKLPVLGSAGLSGFPHQQTPD